jgi:hypothetical protein
MGRIGRKVHFASNQINMLPFLLEATKKINSWTIKSLSSYLRLQKVMA